MVRDGGTAPGFTRNGNNWSDKYLPLVADVARRRCSSAIIDGVVFVPDKQGRSNFATLRASIFRESQVLAFYAVEAKSSG